MMDTDPPLAALIPDPHNDRRQDACTLALIADALRAVVVRRWEGLTGWPAEHTPGAVIVEEG